MSDARDKLAADPLGFKAAKQTLDAIKRIEAKKPAQTEWKDPAARRRHLAQQARDRRAAALDAIVPDRRCPLCTLQKLASRQWVMLPLASLIGVRTARLVFVQGETAVCVSCVRLHLPQVLGKKRKPSHARIAQKKFPVSRLQDDPFTI